MRREEPTVQAQNKSSRCLRHCLVLLMATLSVQLGCVPPEGNEDAGSAGGANLKEAKAEKWIATLDHGDKPGNGYELIVQDGAVISGTFYLLDPNKPRDIASAGQTVPFGDLGTEGMLLEFSITLKMEVGEYRDDLAINLNAPLVGSLGTKVSATVVPRHSSAEPQELEFVRRE